MNKSDSDGSKGSTSTTIGRVDGLPVSGFFVLASIAAYHALTLGVKKVAFGITKEQVESVPGLLQCIQHAQSAALCVNSALPSVELITPLAELNKEAIVTLGARLGVPFGATWSCSQSGSTPCGVCGRCQDRAAAFAAAKISDPSLLR